MLLMIFLRKHYLYFIMFSSKYDIDKEVGYGIKIIGLLR